MTDLRKTIIPKSDQLNADDLLLGPITITITEVAGVKGDQPIIVHYEGENGKPYKPCKSMRRVMAHVWGPYANTFAGKQMTLFRDATVRFGGGQVGGIRISHMSGIEEPMTLALTETRASRKPFTVQPLLPDPLADMTRNAIAITNATAPTLANVEAAKKATAKLAEKLLAAGRTDLHEQLNDAIKALHGDIQT